MKVKWSYLLKALVWLFYLATAYVILDFAARLDWKAFLSLRLDWALFGVAVTVTVLSRFATSHAFIMLLRRLTEAKFSWLDANSAYARSWLGRYMPGKVAGLLARIMFFSSLGVPQGPVAIGSVLEVSLWIFTNFIIGFSCLAFSGAALDLPPEMQTATYVVAGLSLFAVLPFSVNLAVRVILKITGRAHLAEGLKVNRNAILAGIAGVSMAQVVCGLSFWFLAVSMDPGVNFSHFPYVWGVFDIAGAMAIAAVFAPAGIGVREMVLLPFLGRITSPEASLAMLGLLRVVELFADLVYWPASVWLDKTFSGRSERG